MKLVNNLSAIILILVSFMVCEGRNLLRQIDVVDGLPDNFVKWVIKDSDGYMWFATLNGLSRWDGYSFRTYRIGHLGGHNDDVQWVAEDGGGRIWVGNPSGYFAYNKVDDTMRGDISVLLLHLGIDCNPNFLSIDGNKNLWCAGDSTLYYYDFASKHLSMYPLPQGIRIIDAKGWGGSKYVLFEDGIIYSAEGENLIRKDINLPHDNQSRCLYIDRTGRIWLFAQHGHGLRRVEGNSYVEIMPEKLITGITETSDGHMLVATDDSGLLILNEDDSYSSYIPLPDRHINHAYIDSSGILWLCTAKQGIFCRPIRKNPFEVHVLKNDMDVKCIEEANGRLWLGCDGSGMMIDDKSFKAPQLGLPSNMIICQALDKSGRSWYGTYDGGVFLRERGGNSFTPVDDKRLKSVRRITTDSAGTIWFATFAEGLYAMASSGDMLWYHMGNCELNNNSVMDMAFDGNRTLFLGTSSGLFTVDIYDRKFTKIENIDDHYITSLVYDSRGRLWVGSRTGVTLLDQNLSPIRHVGSKDGIPSTWARALIEDCMGRIWMSTDNCLVCIDTKVSVFSRQDGAGDLRFNTHSAATLHDNRLVFGAQGGYTIVNPILINTQYDSHSRIVTITSGLNEDGNIMIGYDDMNYMVEVSSLDFHTLHHAVYEYRISEKDNWSTMSGNKIMFNHMSPGRYNLQVRQAGDKDAPITTAHIIVTPPWWREWWAYAIYAFVILFAVGAIIWRMRLKNIEKLKNQQAKLKAEQQHALDKARINFFTNLSHDLRTPLSLIISPLERMLGAETDSNRKQMLELMHRNAIALLDEINQLLEFRKIGHITPHLNLSHGDLSVFVGQTCQAFIDANIRDGINVRQNLFVDSLFMDFDREKMQHILLNLLSNAIKYNVDGGSVEIDLYEEDGNAVLKVSDTGIGIDPDHYERIFDRFFRENKDKGTGNGIGLSIVKEYVALHHGDIKVSQNQPKGTVFTVKFPMSTSAAVPYVSACEEIDNKKHTLLVVEDNDDFRRFLISTLSDSYKLIPAVNGIDALQKLKDADYNVDVVVSDVMMPEMDGIELCKAVKNNLQSSHIPFIMLTARSSEEHVVNGLRNGADDYIRKPFNIDIFLLRVAKLIDRCRANRQAFGKTVNIEPSEITITPIDEQFIKQAIENVEVHIDDPDFGVETMATEMGVSRSNLYKKIHALTGYSPLEFIRTIRIKRGRQMMDQGGIPISQVAYAVGMSPKNFTKYFREFFGCLPSEYNTSESVSDS